MVIYIRDDRCCCSYYQCFSIGTQMNIPFSDRAQAVVPEPWGAPGTRIAPEGEWLQELGRCRCLRVGSGLKEVWETWREQGGLRGEG